METTNLKWTTGATGEKGHSRPYWNLFKSKRPGFSKYRLDVMYKPLSNLNIEVDSLCEIGSDMGRSTAWLSNIAQTIDVYEQDNFYIDLCKQQCYRHQKKYGPIRNVNWYEVEDISITEVLETLPKLYDAIKISAEQTTQYVPSMLKKLNKGGYLIIDEVGSPEMKNKLVKMLQYDLNFTSNRWDSLILVAKHK